MPPHKVLHLLMPIMIIIPMSMFTRIPVRVISVIVFMLGLVKEIYDDLVYNDPITIFVFDTIANIVGIALAVSIIQLIDLQKLKVIVSKHLLK